MAEMRLSSMKRFFDLFRKQAAPEPPAPRAADFFCLYCNAKFPHDDLPRVVAHLKPHETKEEADSRIENAG
jgi:hypothetical protein